MLIPCLRSIPHLLGALYIAKLGFSNGGEPCGDTFACLAAAASPCAKVAACANVLSGGQSRPRLSGSQPFTNSDGTCKYGHVGANAVCATTARCGATLFECRCVSQERAAAKLYNYKVFLLTIGSVLIAMGTVCLVLRYFKCCHKPSDRVSPVVFTGVCVQDVGPQPTYMGESVEGVVVGNPVIEDPQVQSAPQRKFCFGWFDFGFILTCCVTIVIPLVVMALGGVALVKGVLIQDGTYYNECGMTEG